LGSGGRCWRKTVAPAALMASSPGAAFLDVGPRPGVHQWCGPEEEPAPALLDLVSDQAQWMRRAQPGDLVGVMLPNVPQFAIAYYGILRAGGVVVPMNVLLKERRTGFYLSDSQRPRCSRGTRSTWRPVPAPRPRGPQYIVVEPGEFERWLGVLDATDRSVTTAPKTTRR
jgi:hypothetical protein